MATEVAMEVAAMIAAVYAAVCITTSADAGDQNAILHSSRIMIRLLRH